MNNKIKIYLNLTNGIEFLSDTDFKEDYNFVRIQSCACERHLWNKILSDLDYNFLMDIALGYTVIVCDASPHKMFSRALYQGVEFIKYALNRIWLDKMTIPYVKGIRCDKYFNEEFNKLDKSTLKKIKYLRKFLNTDKIDIICISTTTTHDGDYNYFKKLLVDKYKEVYYE
jgi:hypothetical protein